MVFCARMGTQVPRALISTLLIAGVFYAPFAPLAHADEQIASSTVATTTSTTVSAVVATTTQEEVDAEATTTAQVPATVPDPGPSFVEAIVSHPNHVLRASNFSEQQTALKDGDVVDIAAVVTGAVPASSVTVDATGLDGSSILSLSCDPSYTNTNYPQPLQYCRGRTVTINTGGRIGTTSVTFTATDEAGLTVTKSVDIVLDQLSPVFSNPTLTRTSTSTFSRDETLHFSGTLNGTGSGAKIYGILGEGLAADGSTVLYGSYYNWNHPLLSDVYAIRAGTFSNVSLPLSGAYSGADIPSDVASMRFVFTIEDDAGHVSYATSTVSATSTTPSGPQVSNVLFLPGIKGSRLYRSAGDCDSRTQNCTNELLWEPNNDDLAKGLYLDSSGKSVDYDVHTVEKDILTYGTLYGTSIRQDFYNTFVTEMNALQTSSVYPGWQWVPITYDWRLSLPDIVNNGTKYGDRIYYSEATSTPYIVQTLKELARTSPTGKVTIIAHSNGGLVAKELMIKLGSTETGNLIDKVIFVGVPQTGAPQAVGAELFGYGESLPFDDCSQVIGASFLCSGNLHRDTARSLAENSPMGYHLLPSARYFSDVPDAVNPVIAFDSEHLFEKERSAYGTIIQNDNELLNYLLSTEGGRIKPAFEDITKPNVLNPNLMQYAVGIHSSIDAWLPPPGVQIYQIAGWGKNTVSGIKLYDEPIRINGFTVGYTPKYRPNFVEDGDGVVPVPSALMMNNTENVRRYWLNLVGTRENHGTIFENSDVRTFLNHLIFNNSTTTPVRISSSQPQSINLSKKLLFFLHSPLSLELYNVSGEPAANASYGTFGEVKYVIAPAGIEYKLVMNGYDTGTFSLDIQEMAQGVVTNSSTISNLPTSAYTKATMSITNGISDASPIRIDKDGDGTIDISISPQIATTVTYDNIQNSPKGSLVHRSSSLFETGLLTASPTPELDYPQLQSSIIGYSETKTVLSVKSEYAVDESSKIPERVVSGKSSSITQAASVYESMPKRFSDFMSLILYNINQVIMQIKSFIFSFQI